MDARTLGEAMGWTLPEARYAQLLPAYKKLMKWANITTVNRAAMLAAQLGHESVGLKYQSEIWGPTAAQRTYDGRMGNRRGTDDWSRYRGHGWIQITGRDNHSNVSKWAHSKGLVPTPTFFLDHPEKLGDDHYCWIGPAWYWTVARPQLNTLADNGWIWDATRAINGGTNGIQDRINRWERCKRLGQRLLDSKGGSVSKYERALPYSRNWVTQDTFYNCGPASTQTIILSKTGKLHSEATLGAQLRTTRNGTDWIGQFPRVLNAYMPEARYVHREMPNDPPSGAQKEKLWNDIVNSINGGYGVVANIVAPPSNYPRAVAPSTESPAYRGGVVYHYIAVMGYSTSGQRKCWIADSGFRPYGYWISFDQLASLIPPKGYAYATAKPKNPKEHDMALLTGESAAALNDAKIAAQKAHQAAEEAKRNTILIMDQLAGWPKDKQGRWTFAGWEQLGNRTLVGAVSALMADMVTVKESISEEEK